MFDQCNHSLFQFFAASPNPSGGGVFLAEFVAEQAIWIGPALLVLIWFAGRADDRRAATGAALAALAALAAAAAISALHGHPRPFMDGSAVNYLRHAPDSSFPSDHATLLFALGWALLLDRPPVLSRSWVIAMGLALGMGWSRVYLGAHYPFDIAGAAILALGFALAGGATPLRQLTVRLAHFGEWLCNHVLSPAGLHLRP